MHGAPSAPRTPTAQPAWLGRRGRALSSLLLLVVVAAPLLLLSSPLSAARREHAAPPAAASAGAATTGYESLSRRSSSSRHAVVHTAIRSAPGAAWGRNGEQSGSEASDSSSSSSRRLQQSRLALVLAEQRRRRVSALEQLLVGGSDSESAADAAASAAAKRAATSEGKGTSVLLSDLGLEGDASSSSSNSSSNSTAGSRGPGRLLVAGSQGPPASTPAPPAAAPQGSRAGIALPPSGGGSSSSSSSGSTYQPLCSATINYGASVGDASKKATADVPIYVGSFDVVATQQQLDGGPGSSAGDSGSSSWVLGWQFAAGEYIQMSRDVFGDDGIYSVFMAPNLQPQGSSGGGTDASSGPPPPAVGARLEAQLQRVAVFSNTSLGAANNEVVFSFVGRKGPDAASPTAPFRVAPPTAVFLNNHYCWPLFRPGGGSGGTGASTASAAAAAAAAGAKTALGSSSSGSRPAQPQPQVMVEVASPQLQPAAQPKQLQVEYLPVEFAPTTDDPALFGRTVTQFYFKVTNAQPGPVYLDQVVLQYWFNGPLDTDAADGGSSSGGGNNTISGSSSGGSGGNGMVDVVARVSASQFRLTCSDATLSVGCGGLAWNVTPGLPTVFGARFTLNIWFPLTFDVTDANSSSATSSNSSSGQAQRFLLLPANASTAAAGGGNGSSDTPAADLQLRSVVGPDGAVTVVQPLQAFQAIVAIEPRRFFANISASNDYSFIETPEVAGQQQQAGSGGLNTSNSTGRLVRRKREPNPRLPAYISDTLAWGSPPVGGKMALRPGLSVANGSAAAAGAFPPGSYCQPSPGGGLVCGVDVLYCCLGSTPLNLSAVPPDWPSRLATGSNDPSAADDLAAAAAAGGGTVAGGGGGTTSPPGSGQRALPGWGVALAVVLPAITLAAAVAAALLVLRRRRHVQRRTTGHSLSGQQQGLWSAGSGGSDDGGGGGSLLPLSIRAPPLQGAAGAAGHAWQQQQQNGSSTPPLLMGLLTHPNSSYAHHVGAQPGPRAPAPAGMQLQQQLAELQLLELQGGPMQQQHSMGQPVYSRGWQQQHPYASALAAAGMQHHLLRVLKPKVPSLPADVIAAAVALAKQLQQQLRWSSSAGGSNDGNGSEPGSPLTRLLHNAARSLSPHRSHSSRHGSSSAEPRDAGGSLPRANSWTGWLHEDAFEDDLLDQLLALHMCPPPPALLASPTAAAAASGSQTADGVWQQLQSSQQQQAQHPHVGAAVAAVEAAAAAINALMSSSGAGAAGGGTSSGGGSPAGDGGVPRSSPSFFNALMATGGMIRPPGGAPIPLNVNFAAEIQPNLGRLLGRGGFGHVYEAVWRGQRVAVKLLSVDTDDPAVLDAFLKEVALCACLRGCDRVVRLLGACLGGCSPQPPGSGQLSSSAGNGSSSSGNSNGSSGNGNGSAAASPGSAEALSTVPSGDTPTPFARGVPPDLLADDAAASSCCNGGGGGFASSVRQAGFGGGGGGQQQQQSGQGQGPHQQQQQQQLALIMELVEGGNLAHRIYHPGKRALSYLEILQVGLDVAAGLAYLHPVVVHRDLKPQNVLLDRQGRAKIADFGISRFKDPHRSYLSVTHQGGTPNYMAPELFNASRVDEAADVWSLGCILYECLARRQPFGHLADDGRSFNVLFKIIVAVAINKERPLLPADAPPRLAALICHCWAEDPAARPRVGQLLAELEGMMKEALRERAERLGRGSRLSGSARSQSLPAHAHASSIDRAGSSASSADVLSAMEAAAAAAGGVAGYGSSSSTTIGSHQQQRSSIGSGGSSPRRHVRGALTLPAGHVAAAPTESAASSRRQSGALAELRAGSSSVALGAFGSELQLSGGTGLSGAAPAAAGAAASSLTAAEVAAAAAAAAGGGGYASNSSTPYHTLPSLAPAAAQHLQALVAHAHAELPPAHSARGLASQQQLEQSPSSLEQSPEQARCVSRSSSCHSQYEWDCSCAACTSHHAAVSSASGYSSPATGLGCGDAPPSVNSSPNCKLASAGRAASAPAAALPSPAVGPAGLGLSPVAGGFGLQSRPSTGPAAPPTPSRPAAGAAAPRTASRHSRSSSVHSLGDAGLLATSSGLLSRQQSLPHPWQSAAAAAAAAPGLGLQAACSLQPRHSAASSCALVRQASDSSGFSSSSAWTRLSKQQSAATSVAVRSAPSSPERGKLPHQQQQQQADDAMLLTVQPLHCDTPVPAAAQDAGLVGALSGLSGSSTLVFSSEGGSGSSAPVGPRHGGLDPGHADSSGVSVNSPRLVPVAPGDQQGAALHRQQAAETSAHSVDASTSSLYMTAPTQFLAPAPPQGASAHQGGGGAVDAEQQPQQEYLSAGATEGPHWRPRLPDAVSSAYLDQQSLAAAAALQGAAVNAAQADAGAAASSSGSVVVQRKVSFAEADDEVFG